MRSSRTMDLTQGSVSQKMLVFAIPILLGSVLQHLYSVADRIVVGRFAENGDVALAAIGATASATMLLLNLFNGLSIGANVICSNLRGARKELELRQCMHTSVLLAVVSGVLLCAIGLLITKPMLLIMATPADVLDTAALYMRICFLGVPATLIYNYGAAILRANGDTKRPMYILTVSGLVNVALNLLLVIAFGLGVDGVAIATVVSQIISAVAVLIILFSPKDEYKLRWKELKFHGDQLKNVIRVGIPCGLNGIVFSISNVTVQSSVNSFNSTAIIAGNTAATDLANIIYLVINAFFTANISFAGQCCGARKYKRIDQVLISSCLMCMGVMTVLATVITIFPRPLLGLFNSDPQVIDAGVFKLILCAWGYLLYCISELSLGCVRGMGKSTVPMLLNFIGVCVTRMVWIFAFFPLHRTTEMLYLCYPISWAISATMQFVYFLRCRKQLYTVQDRE